MKRGLALGAAVAVASVAAIAYGAFASGSSDSGGAARADRPEAAGPVVTTPAPPASSAPPAVCADDITTGEATGGAPTGAQRVAAARLVADTRAAVRPYENFATAVRRGFRSLDTMHWYNPAFYTDNRVLDPSRPEFLMYDNAHHLLGAMYVEHGRAGPQIGGPLTVWHTHCLEQMPCLLPGTRLIPSEAAECAGRPQVKDWMLHVWLVPNRLGAFGHQMVVPQASS